MNDHLRANLWLLGITLLVCSVLYPLALLGVGQVIFPNQAQGSLLDDKGEPTTDPARARGSRLIAQEFKGDEYFQPRPSAASYKAEASSGSNWAASNYQLRDRVARQLGPLVKFSGGPHKGEFVGPHLERWFQKDIYQGQPGIVAQWARMHPGLAADWVKQDRLNSDEVSRWASGHHKGPQPKPEDLAVPYFESFSRNFPGKWPAVVEVIVGGKTSKQIKPVDTGNDIQSVFFDMWRQDHPTAELENVPADLVMASGSGLDPHITLANARYQLKHRVAAAQAGKLIKARVEELARARGKTVDEAGRKQIEDQVRREAQARVGKPLEEKV